MSGRVVISCYRPKPGCEGALDALVAEHYSCLAAEGLVSDRTPVVMKAADGTVVEVFEWASKEAVAQAHESATIGKLWGEFAEVCEFVPIGNLPEAGQLFSEFTPS